jgi:hypothetical protein
MRYPEVNIGGCDQQCGRVKLNLSDRIGEEFVGVTLKVLQQLKLHKVLHHHLDDPLVADLVLMNLAS